MSDISKINVDGVDYDVKDATARKLCGFFYDVNTSEEIDAKLQEAYNSIGVGEFKFGKFNSSSLHGLTGGEWVVFLSNSWNSYGFVIAIQYNTGGGPNIKYRNYYNNAWTDWVSLRPLPIVTTSDNGKVLKVVNGVWTAIAE